MIFGRGTVQRTITKSWARGLLWLLAPWATAVSAPLQVLVSYEDGELPVVAMQGASAVVVANGERMVVPNGRLRVVEAESYTDGAVEILHHNAMMGQDYGSPLGGFYFRFDAQALAERDFDDCFVLFIIEPEVGEATYVMRELPDIHSEGQERILVTLPVNPGFGGGAFEYKLFSRGEEIRRYEPYEPIEVTELGNEGKGAAPQLNVADPAPPREARAQAVGVPARVIRPRLLEYPANLLGSGGGSYASAVFTIDEHGNALELLSLEAERPEFAKEVWEVIAGSVYEPGRFNGNPLTTTVRQTYFFNEFAPFTEEMITVPYPEIGDRNASPLYMPLPTVAGAKRRKVEVEISVDLLGSVEKVAFKGKVPEALHEALEASARNWVFLPGVADGYPVAQTLKMALEVGPPANES